MRNFMSPAVILAIVIIGQFSTAWAQPSQQTYRMALNQRTEIQGYTCATGVAWFFSNGQLNRCTVAIETVYGVAVLPAGSIVALREDGKPEFAFLSHDAWIAGAKCRGGSWLGPSEGASTTFYPSGQLKQCFLAGDQNVQGVPCMNGGFFGDGVGTGVLFYENGKLKSCKLAVDYDVQKRGDRFVQGP
jgi:hypothetical protein